MMFRLANGRRNSLIEVEAQIIFSYNEMENGKLSRKFQTLKLDVERISYLSMSWTVVHPINEDSAMTNLTQEDLKAVDAEFFIGIKGIDDTYAQQVHARASYKWNDVIWNARFLSVIGLNEQGINTVDVSKLNHHELIKN